MKKFFIRTAAVTMAAAAMLAVSPQIGLFDKVTNAVEVQAETKDLVGIGTYDTDTGVLTITGGTYGGSSLIHVLYCERIGDLGGPEEIYKLVKIIVSAGQHDFQGQRCKVTLAGKLPYLCFIGLIYLPLFHIDLPHYR